VNSIGSGVPLLRLVPTTCRNFVAEPGRRFGANVENTGLPVPQLRGMAGAFAVGKRRFGVEKRKHEGAKECFRGTY
jgi:hypothetical protein